MHEKATRDRPMRGRQRLFFTIAGVIGIVVVAAIGLVIVLIR
jgi:NhaP-type Na+/H+ or K+/H+ antiporter